MEKRNYDHRLWLGVAAILIGLIFLANNFGILNYEIQRYVLRWEVLLMFLGLVFIAGRGRHTTGIILLVIGGVFYLRDFFHYSFNFWQIFWPSFLIFIGLMIIFRHRIDRGHVHPRWDMGNRKEIIGDDILDELAVFGGGDRVVHSQQFRGGRVTTIFGGLNYDMLRAKLAPGENYIDVLCVFGGMKLVIPEDWNVKIRVMSLFGGFSDKHRTKSPVVAPENGTHLIIKGMVFFGGGEIKSYYD